MSRPKAAVFEAEMIHYTLEKELAATIFASRQWRCYLDDKQPIYIHSDQIPLCFLQTQKKLTGQRPRWFESLSQINWYITYIPEDRNVVADAVSKGTHLPKSQVVLHDGHTLAAVKPQEPYSALSLTTALVRRDSTQFYETTSYGYPTSVDGSGATSSGNTSAPNPARQISPEEFFSAPTSENTPDLHRPVQPTFKTIPCFHLHSGSSIASPTSMRQLQRPPPPPTRITRSTQRRTTMSTVHTPEVTPPRLLRPSPPPLPPPPPTAGSSGRISTPALEHGMLPSEETDGMICRPARQPLHQSRGSQGSRFIRTSTSAFKP